MPFARRSRSVEVAIGWAAGGLSGAAFIWDAITPGSGFQGRLAIAFVVVAAAAYVGTKHERVMDQAIVAVRDCVDESIGSAAQFGREAERRRLDDRASLAIVHDLPRNNNRGGKR